MVRGRTEGSSKTDPKIWNRVVENSTQKSRLNIHIHNNHLSHYLCGFQKGYNTQHGLIAMLEKWRKALDKCNIAGALLNDLFSARGGNYPRRWYGDVQKARPKLTQKYGTELLKIVPKNPD